LNELISPLQIRYRDEGHLHRQRGVCVSLSVFLFSQFFCVSETPDV